MEACWTLLRGQKDEEKFAGLLLVAKYLNKEAEAEAKSGNGAANGASTGQEEDEEDGIAPSKHGDKSEKIKVVEDDVKTEEEDGVSLNEEEDEKSERIKVIENDVQSKHLDILFSTYQAIGFSFLRRLVCGSRQRSDSDMPSPPSAYQTLGLNVVSSLTLHPKVAADFRPAVPYLLLLLRYFAQRSSRQNEMEEKTKEQKEANSTAALDPAAQDLALEDTFTVLFHILKHLPPQDPSNGVSPLLMRPETLVMAAQIISQAPSSSIAQSGSLMIREVLRLQDSGGRGSESEEMTRPILLYGTVLTLLAPVFGAGHSLAQLTLLPSLSIICHQVLEGQQEEQKANTKTLLPAWSLELREGLCQVLSSRMRETERHHALLLSQLLLDTFGEAWLMATQKNPTSSLGAAKCEPKAEECTTGIRQGKFAEVLFTTVSVETRVLLMEAGQPRVYGQKPLKDATVTACFVMVLALLRFLVREDVVQDGCAAFTRVKDLPSEQLFVFKARFEEVIGGILQYFRDLSDDDIHSSLLLVPALQLLVAWFAEDNSPDIYKAVLPLIPFMLQIVASPDERSPKDTLASRTLDPKIITILLPLLSQLLTSSELEVDNADDQPIHDRSMPSPESKSADAMQDHPLEIKLHIVEVLQKSAIAEALIKLLEVQLIQLQQWSQAVGKHGAPQAGPSPVLPASVPSFKLPSAALTEGQPNKKGKKLKVASNQTAAQSPSAEPSRVVVQDGKVPVSAVSEIPCPLFLNDGEFLQHIVMAADLLFAMADPVSVCPLLRITGRSENQEAMTEGACVVRELLVRNLPLLSHLSSTLYTQLQATPTLTPLKIDSTPHSHLYLVASVGSLFPLLVLATLLKSPNSSSSSSTHSQSALSLVLGYIRHHSDLSLYDPNQYMKLLQLLTECSRRHSDITSPLILGTGVLGSLLSRAESGDPNLSVEVLDSEDALLAIWAKNSENIFLKISRSVSSPEMLRHKLLRDVLVSS
eukprot:gb/GEZN01001369.1/.p1 GENE.gb/GEZN01001369.1/~~gb/GEZN01001369.1/.p1  ORF type:complete len:984 (-),score=144.42 gb/GEZN01001369.1/:2-2953(-)